MKAIESAFRTMAVDFSKINFVDLAFSVLRLFERECRGDELAFREKLFLEQSIFSAVIPCFNGGVIISNRTKSARPYHLLLRLSSKIPAAGSAELPDIP